MMYAQVKQKAFSFIEALIVIAIVSIVTGYGINAYNRNVAKQMVVKAIHSADYLRQAVEDYYSLYGYMPGNRDLMNGPGAPYIKGYLGAADQPWYVDPEPGIQRVAYGMVGNPTNFCNDTVPVCTQTGNTAVRRIEISFSQGSSRLTSGKTFFLQANLQGGGITWECAVFNYTPYGFEGALDPSLLPTSCYNPALNDL